MSSEDIMKVIRSEQQKASTFRKQNDNLRTQLEYDLGHTSDPDQQENERQRLQSEIDSNEQNAKRHDDQVARLTAEYDQAVKAEQAEREKEAQEAAKKQKRSDQISNFFGL